MTQERKALLKQPFVWWVLFLSLLIGGGLAAAFLVFARGLVVTNLSDLVPWGLWIGIDLSSIALSAGAFTLSAAVYLLRKKDLEPVARTAVFVGFVGYSMALLCLVLDIGQPLRFWHGWVYWNIHSPLWEVTMCITLYFTVLTLEVMPTLSRIPWLKTRYPAVTDAMQRTHRFAPYLALIGLCLSMLHQSSLGLTYGVLVARPFWYKPWLAVLFLVTAAVAGPALVVMSSKIAARITPRAVIDQSLLNRVSRYVMWGLVVIIVLRFLDLLALSWEGPAGKQEAFQILTSGAYAWHFWGGEIILGLLLPLVILATPELRRHERFHVLALALVVGGLVAYRWNTTMVGQMVVLQDLTSTAVPLYTTYVPSLVELMAAGGIIAYGLLAFTLGTRYLHVVDHRRQHHDEETTAVAPPAFAPGD